MHIHVCSVGGATGFVPVRTKLSQEYSINNFPQPEDWWFPSGGCCGMKKEEFLLTPVTKSAKFVFCKRRLGTSVIMRCSAVPIFSLGGEWVQGLSVRAELKLEIPEGHCVQPGQQTPLQLRFASTWSQASGNGQEFKCEQPESKITKSLWELYCSHLKSSYGKVMQGVQENLWREGVTTVFHCPLCLKGTEAEANILYFTLGVLEENNGKKSYQSCQGAQEQGGTLWFQYTDMTKNNL